ncbi:MAG TPA: CBS domain-containing protein [Nitrososphaeraceae archaeon]|nr:CBS domain-containing protein [Nitrososphaeraceae archaeon]
MNDLVQDIMTKDVVAVDENMTALDAARLMTEKGISSLIIEKDHAPVGIISERDFVKKICLKDMQPSTVNVGSIMSKIQTYASPDTPVDVAVQRMVNHKIRRLPVISDGKVIGIITVTDLAKHLRTILLIEGILSDEN